MISDKLRGRIKASKMVDQSKLMHLVTGLSDKKQTVTKKTPNWSLWTGETLRCTSSDDNEAFQRPQSLISCPCYQRFILWSGGGQQPWSQRPRASVLDIKG